MASASSIENLEMLLDKPDMLKRLIEFEADTARADIERIVGMPVAELVMVQTEALAQDELRLLFTAVFYTDTPTPCVCGEGHLGVPRGRDPEHPIWWSDSQDEENQAKLDAFLK